MADTTTFPKMPEANWWQLREQFKKTLPATVTPGYLKSLLGLKTDQAAKNLIPPLRRMGLIGEDNRPTARANEWRSDAKYADVCKQIVSELYPNELRDLFSGSTVDRSKLKQWFMDSGALGSAAATQAAAMYILLTEASVKDPEEKPKKKSGLESNTRTNKTSKPSKVPSQVAQSSADSGQDQQSTPSPTLHIDLQIHIAADADEKQIEKIFSSIAKYLYQT